MSDALGACTSGLEQNYVVLACVTAAAVAWAMLRARLRPVALGWGSIAFAAALAALNLAKVGPFVAPLGVNLSSPLFGANLLIRGDTSTRAGPAS
jgi:hypothetical protein